MDIVAFRIWRPQITVQPGDIVTARIWKTLKHDNGALPGATKTLEAQGKFYGLCWMFNPHELSRIKKFYDPETGLATRHGIIPVWIYALIPRGVAAHRRLTASRKKTGPLAYPPDHFSGKQVFPCN